jgi:predicted alpha-1,2-mannosidase
MTLAIAVAAGGLVSGAGAAQGAATQLAAAVTAEDYTQYVDPFVSTEDDFGQDMPGAAAPHGLAKVNPMTTPGRSHSGYDYAETKIAGFTSTNLDGAGGSGGGGDLLVVPTYVDYTKRPDTNSYAKSYSHDAEEATPGYYGVDLTTTQGTDGSISDTAGSQPIKAEVTADVRSSFQRYTFPNAGTASLVVDLRNNYTSRVDASLDVTTLSDGRAALSGYVVGSFSSNNYKLYYYAETTTPVKSVQTWGGDGALTNATKQNGTELGAIIDVDAAAGQTVELKTTLSPLSVDQARIDMANELGERTFDEVRADTKAAWNEVLARVDVDATVTSDPDGSLKKLFYTHLYRLFGSPVNTTSTTGTYRGADGVVYETNGSDHYDSWYLWDDFRKYSILAIAYPEVYADIVQSLVDLYAEFANTNAGSMTNLTHSAPTVRYERAPVVIADAVSKGVSLDNLDLAFAGLKRTVGGGYNADNTARGYLADDVDDTLGTAYDDWAMSTIAEAVGATADAEFYLDRATNYTNLFNPAAWTNGAGEQVGLIQPKDASGNWWQNVDSERFEAANLYQGTLWQYNWYVANDMGGMVELMGGRDHALSAVSHLFGEEAPDDGTRMLHSNANEIDLQAPYLFNYVGSPSSTQYWVRNIYTKETWNRYIATGSTGEVPSSGGEFRPPVKDKVFELAPDGFLPTMDNDAGTMSATFVAAAMGLFPVTAGGDTYQIGSPFFEKVTIDRDGGEPFVLAADGVSPDDFYIQSAELNGASFDRTWVSYDEIVGGGELSFQMGDAASEWAADGPQPDSLSDHVDSAVYDRRGDAPLTTSSRVFEESEANDGTAATTITVTAHGTSFAGDVDSDLAAAGLVTTTGVPEGMTLRAVKKAQDRVELTLAGSAASHLTADAIDDLGVEFAEAAFSSAVEAEQRMLTLRVDFRGSEIAIDQLEVRADDNGAVAHTATISLAGGATFAGADGSDLLFAGTAQVRDLPAGLTATLVRTAETTLALTVTGALAEPAASEFTLRFTDGAFANGVTARSVTGDGGVLAPFTVTVGAEWRDRLAGLLSEANLLEQGNYSPASFAAVVTAREKAQALLDDAGSTPAALEQAFFTLTSAIDALELGEGGYRRLEGEASDTWSGGDLKNESINLGGVKPGAWIGYEGMDFSEGAPASIDIRYVANSGRTSPDSAVEIRADSPTGELAATVPLPHSGADWNAYTTITAAISDPSVLADASSVYFVFRGTITDSLPWIANLDYFEFDRDDAATPEVPTFAKLDTSNASALHTGIDKSQPMFQNVNDTEWASYLGYDFGAGVETLSVNYDKPSTRTTENTSVEVHLGSIDAPASAVVPLTYTASGWGTYATTTIDVDPAVFTGKQDVYFVFRAPGNDGAHPYVANIAWLQFGVTVEEAPTSLRLEAESFAEKSGAVAVENSTDPQGVPFTNLKNTNNGDWLRYDGVDFGENTATSMTVRYVNNSSRVGANSRIEVYLDSRDGAPTATVPLPVTGSAWSAISTTTFALPTAITGSHTLYLVLRTEPDANHPYVSNIDWYEFGYGVDKGGLNAAIAQFQPLAELGDRYLAADFRTFTRALETATSVAADANASKESVGAATRSLRLAAGQLEWRVIRQLAQLVIQSEAVDPAGYTPESYAPLATALETAKAIAPDAAYEEYEQTYAALRTAFDGLVAIVPQPVGEVDGALKPGGRIELVATHLAPSAHYALLLQDGEVALGEGTSDANGSLTLSVTLPADAQPGDHTLLLRGDDGATALAVPVVLEEGSSSGDQQVEVEIPELSEGEFLWTIEGGNGLVDLGTAEDAGDHFLATGAINPILVTDTRRSAPEWTVSAEVGDFVSGDDTIGGEFLGWTPELVEAGGGAEAGAPVASGFDGGDGLSVASLLGRAASGHPLGSTRIGADLTLKLPMEVADGTYRATLTLTALS